MPSSDAPGNLPAPPPFRDSLVSYARTSSPPPLRLSALQTPAQRAAVHSSSPSTAAILQASTAANDVWNGLELGRWVREQHALHERARKRLPENVRLQDCLTAPISPGLPVKVYVSPKGALHFDNLRTCGQAFCPYCGPRLMRDRRAETKRLAAAAHRSGLQTVRVDLTHGHRPGDQLADLIDAEQKAFAIMGSGKSALSGKLRRAGVGYRGMRRAADIMHGPTGWHPHHHALMLLDARASIPDVTSIITDRWAAATQHAGLTVGAGAVLVELVDVDGAGYLYKTGVRDDQPDQYGRTPYQLLRAAVAGDDLAGELWDEYARALQGRRLTVTSPGLCKLARLQSDTDPVPITPAWATAPTMTLTSWPGVTPDLLAALTDPLPGMAAD